nr:hypothetical protein BaRGS_024093 [Batillaria attramentaria]
MDPEEGQFTIKFAEDTARVDLTNSDLEYQQDVERFEHIGDGTRRILLWRRCLNLSHPVLRRKTIPVWSGKLVAAVMGLRRKELSRTDTFQP